MPRWEHLFGLVLGLSLFVTTAVGADWNAGKPQINGPRTYGTPRGLRFSYALPTCGAREGLKFSIAWGKLPDGVTLDPETGVLSGTPQKETEQSFVVRAANKFGKCDKLIQIKVGRFRALTPPMGGMNRQKGNRTPIEEELAAHGYQFWDRDSFRQTAAGQARSLRKDLDATGSNILLRVAAEASPSDAEALGWSAQVAAGPADSLNDWLRFIHPGFWYDPETLGEPEIDFALRAILPAPLILPDDVGKMSDETLARVTNDDLIGINQDYPAAPAAPTDFGPGRRLWTRRLADGRTVLGYFNSGSEPWSVAHPLPVKAKVRDALRQCDLGEMSEIVATVPPHGCCVWVVASDGQKERGLRHPPREFLATMLDTTRPGLTAIPGQLAANDLAGAEKTFADFIRKTFAVLPPVKKLTPAELETLKAKAEKVMDYTMTSCGYEYHFTNQVVVWDYNPHPIGYVEWPYQLNRHADLSTLAKYYRATGDERAAKTWVSMMDSWFEQLPVPVDAESAQTRTWRTIECGGRIQGFLGNLSIFLKSPAVTDDFIARLFCSHWEHGARLCRRSAPCGNWLLIEMKGLLNAAARCPFLKDAGQWRDHVDRELKRAIDEFIYPDGYEYEIAGGYHTAVVCDFLDARSTYLKLGLPEPSFITNGLVRSFDPIVLLSDPSGRMAPHGDSTTWFDRKRASQIALGLYQDRADYRWFATDGKAGKVDYLSLVLPYVGLVTFRNSWQSDAVWGYFDGGALGIGHHHEDKLNFLMYAYGKRMLTEAEHWAYDSSNMRRYVTDTRAHNTIRIDGMSQRRIPKCHLWEYDIHQKAKLDFTTSSARDLAAASYDDGYGKDFLDVRHVRKVIFVKDQPDLGPFFVIVDRLTAKDDAEHRYEAIWHLTAEGKLALDGRTFAGEFGDGVGFTAAVSDPAATIADKKGTRNPYQGWLPNPKIVDGSDNHIPTATPVVEAPFVRSRRVVTVFIPYRNGQIKRFSVTASPDVREQTIVIEGPGVARRTIKE